MNDRFKKFIAIIVSSLLICLCFTSCNKKGQEKESTTAESESYSLSKLNFKDTTQNVKKTETVYVNIKPDGSVRKTLVSDWLHSDVSGVYIDDKTTLKNISVTKGEASAIETDGALKWQMASTDVYYQGESDAPLPVSVEYTYALNGKPMTYSQIAGKAGKVTITIKIKNNMKKEVTIGGKKHIIYTPLFTMGAMMLPYGYFNDIEVGNALSIGSGTNEMIVMAGSPGLNESLNLKNASLGKVSDFSFSDTFTVTAHTVNFRLADTYMAVMPLTSMNLDIKLPKTVEEVREVLGKITDLSAVIKSIDPNSVIKGFLTDNKNIDNMLDTIKKAVTLYDNNKELIAAFSEYMTPENLQKLTSLTETLTSDQTKQLMSVLSNVPRLRKIIAALSAVSGDLKDVQPILDGINEKLKDPKVASQLQKMPETLKSIGELTSYLEKNRELIDVMSKLMKTKEMQGLTGSLDALLQQVPTSDMTGNADSKEFVQLFNEWLKFDYKIYTDAPSYMKTGCMIVFKTDPVK